MLEYLVNRILQTLLVVAVMSALVFVGIYMIGDPIAMMASPDATELEREAIRQSLGLDKPLLVQYGVFVLQTLQGDFGRSFLAGQPAMDLILERLPATLEMTVLAMLLAVMVGVPLGIFAGLQPKSIISKFLMAASILGFSLPTFWVALMMIMIFSIHFGILPSTGRGQTVMVLGVPLSFLTWDGILHLVLPVCTLAMAKAAMIMRLTRATTVEILPLDYIKLARAKGLRERRVLGVHLLKNILIPVITVSGLELGQLIAFAVITETIFAWPGMGKLLIDSIITLDRPVVVAYLMLVILFLSMLNLVVDILYSIIDPRVRLEAKSR
ncbi:ABC transporter permease [Tianweitania sp.]|uniref:ABC transporter permease n=1 Tax=Tianweitania sp. TaxID=2021634 RepID=UPI00289D8A5C|nr:ABC transporter permease [Tianweitania sp.]